MKHYAPTHRFRSSLFSAVLLTLLAALLMPVTPSAAQQDDTETVDIIVMLDGRELRGTIVEESETHVRFEMQSGSIRSVVPLAKTDIASITRDVAVENPDREEDARPRRDASQDSTRTGRLTRTSDDPSVPGVYVIPMKGQMGTDIHPSVYKQLKDDILERNPEIIVLELHCSDIDDMLIPLNESTEQGQFLEDEYRELINFFKDELGHIRQVMWVGDSFGFSSLVVLAWEDMYMKPRARLAGLARVAALAGGWSDPDVKAKMLAAWLGIGRSFLEYGGYSFELAEAMMRPEKVLSGTFEGRDIQWRLDTSGEYVVDPSDERSVVFNARTAENLLVSDGTAENLDDLMFLLGYREYRVLETAVPRVVEGYVETWRRRLDDSFTAFDDYQKYMGWATGEDTIKYLGRARSELNKIISLMNQYEAIETRWRIERGVQKLQLEIQSEILAEQIAQARRQRR